MMVALFIYAYYVGIRHSCQMERACGENVAFKMITENKCRINHHGSVS